MKRAYVPDAGDFVWLASDPQLGREQRGRRPALILSPKAYNGRAGLALACPVTTQMKGYPFEVPIPSGLGISGAVLSDHLTSLDWKERNAEFVGRAPADVLNDVRERLRPILGF